jgi:ubiquinone/menaquinone biosynthesis C-methylase UbiE
MIPIHRRVRERTDADRARGSFYILPLLALGPGVSWQRGDSAMKMREALSVDALQSIYGRVAQRYDAQHGFLTAYSDGRGRELLVRTTVHARERVLDCGAGTGSTGLLAARKVGPTGHVTLFDLSPDMLAVAEQKAKAQGVRERIELRTGDLVHLPFADGSFDVVLSTYSLCPVYDPAKGALELYRVVKPGGLVGVAHSAEARGPIRPLANAFESLAWKFRMLSIGCRAVEVLPTLLAAGAELVLEKRIGVPLWPFEVFVVRKPAAASTTPSAPPS